MKQALALWLYGALLRIVTPLYLLRLWRRGAAERPYREHLGERLALYRGAAPGHGWVWIHAVSLGETRAAAPLIDALRERQPELRLLLTCSTATGRETGEQLLRAGDAQCWLPFDTPGAVRRFLAHWQPAIGVMMETEIWPQLLRATERAGVPVVLASARLSARSARRGQRLKSLLHPAGQRLALALAQSEADAERIRAAGVTRVLVMGNLKYDLQPDMRLVTLGRQWRERLGRPVLLLAVSREGEEAMLLAQWRRQPDAQRPLLVVVPRHPQRFDEVATLIEGTGLTLARRSQWSDAPPDSALGADAWLGDSMREMPMYYGLADVALLGGSFEKLGGQNLIEAAACGCPVVMGPHTFNFSEAASLAAQAGAAQRVADMSEGLSTSLALCQDQLRRAAAGAAAERFAAAHRGAAARMADAILAVKALRHA